MVQHCESVCDYKDLGDSGLTKACLWSRCYDDNMKLCHGTSSVLQIHVIVHQPLVHSAQPNLVCGQSRASTYIHSI